MRTDNLFTALFLLSFSAAFLYLLVKLIYNGWKRKYFPTGTMTTAHGVTLCGQLLAAGTLVLAILLPLRDYFNMASVTGHLDFSSAPLWGLLLLCAGTAGITYLLAMFLSGILVKSLFKGKSTAVELQENNLVYGLIFGFITLAFSVIFFLPIIVLIQNFVPVPAIPNIR